MSRRSRPFGRRRLGAPHRLAAAVVAGAVVLHAAGAHAQSIEPRFYSNSPVGVNFVIGGFAYTRGGAAFDPSLPITDPNLQTSSPVIAYARSFALGDKSAKFDFYVPYTWLSGSAIYQGDPVTRDVNGLADPLVRVSVNFYGAPALALPEFRSYQQDLILGASLQVSVPAGQYDATKLVNIGSHRWFFKPELGASQALGRWTIEAKAAVTLFTTNRDFYNGNVRAQDPLYSTQLSAIYNFESGIWMSIDGTYFAGGRTTLNGERGTDLQQNWRAGTTVAIPVDLHNSIKLYGSRGVSARTGNSYDLLGVAWQYRWGGGL